MTKIRPFLKWAGSKYRCIETILHPFPPAKRLIEPFMGSGAVFVNSNYSNYLLAEDNGDLITLYTCLQKEGESFIEYCSLFFSEKNNCKERYYYFRNTFNSTQSLRYKAALFLYLNRHGYNGLCRYNQRGLYNVPFGRYNKPYFPRKEMRLFYEKSRDAQFVLADFRQTFAQAERGDLIYCDPPYVPLSKTSKFVSYTQKHFGTEDQIELANLAELTASRGITVIISNHDTEFTRHHYRHSEMISFPVSRFISCHSATRQAAQELLAVFRA